MGGQAVAEEITAEALGLTLLKQSHIKEPEKQEVVDFHASLKEASAKGDVNGKGKLAFTLDNNSLTTIRKTQHFDQFANEPTGKDYWTTLSAILSRGTAKTTWDEADINIQATSDVKAKNFIAVGINNKGGTIDLTGKLTNINVVQQAQGSTSTFEDGDLAAIGYLSLDVSSDDGGSSQLNLKAEKTTINVVNEAQQAVAVGILTAPDNGNAPSITAEGNVDIITKSSSTGQALGVYSAYFDWDSEDDRPATPYGQMTFKKNLNVNAQGGRRAFGLVTENSDITVEGNTNISVQANQAGKANTDAMKPANGAYGIYVTSTGHLTLKGDQTVVNAEKALWLTKHKPVDGIITNYEPIDLQKYTASVKLHAKNTTLNGKVFTEEGTELDLQNTINLNGDAKIEGHVTGSADVVLNTKGTLTFGKPTQKQVADKDESTFKQLTFNGGRIDNHTKMRATKAIFDNGATFYDDSGFFEADHFVFGQNSKYLVHKSLLDKETTDKTIALTFSDGVMEFAGGTIGTIENPTLTNLALGMEKDADKEGSNAAKNDGVLLVSAGAYDWESIKLNMDKQTDVRFKVTGGKVNVKTLTATKGDAIVTDRGILNVDKLVSNGVFGLDAQGANGFKVGTFEGQTGGDFTLSGGTMSIGTLNLTNGKLTISTPATLLTTSGQVFTTGLHANGSGAEVGSLKYSDKLVFQQDSTLTLTDNKYNLAYADKAIGLLKGNASLTFTGTAVSADGSALTEVGMDYVAEDTTHANVDLTAKADTQGTVTVDKSVGGKTLVVETGSKVEVAKDKTLTLVGAKDANQELVAFKVEGQNQSISATDGAGISLGTASTQTAGKISTKVELADKAHVTAQNGNFTLKEVAASNASINVKSGALTVEKLAVSGTSSIASAEKAETKVTELTLADNGTTTVTGAVTADKITVAEGKTATLNVGKSDKRGDLTVGKDSVLKGLTFFLDPTWVDGKKVTDASRLVINKTDLDGNVIVGHNSYVVLGSASDADFVKLFQNGTLTWGKGEGKTLAAAYVAKPITIKGGSLVVDGTLEKAPTDATAAGTVKFAADSVLVADVTGLTKDKALITGTKFDVAQNSKAVIIGDLKNGETYKLTNADKADFWNKKDTLVSGNPLWNLSANADGTFGADLADAKVVFGDLMQGHAIANAGMLSDKADLKAYVNKLLTDELGKAPLDMLGARFDAAMNVAGAAATFTTAYDRASEFRDAVRGEAIAGEGNRLWAQITGGKTKLKGISTGAQSLHVDTDAYGLVIGGDTVLNGYTVGAAFTAGKGDSENKAVGVKDDFDFYGLSVYGKTAVGGVDLVADASMTFLKSDLTMGGVADVDTDTDTTVYSMGVQAQKTFDFGVDVTPYVGLDLYHLRADGYSNGHGAQVDDANATALEIPMGATVSKAFDTTSGFKLKPVFHFAVVPTVGDRDIDSKVRFAGAQSTYNFTFADDVKVRTGLGLAAEKDNFRFGFNAGYDWGNEERAATKLMLNVQYLF